jgi:adenylate cyclase
VGELFDEQISGPARERLLSGELDAFPRDATEASIRMHRLLPRLMTWLAYRYGEQLIVEGIVERFEEFLASRGLVQPRTPGPPPAVAFVDISGYTRLTEQLGDQAAARTSSVLQDRAAEAIADIGDGRLVKLLGRRRDAAVPGTRRRRVGGAGRRPAPDRGGGAARARRHRCRSRHPVATWTCSATR